MKKLSPFFSLLFGICASLKINAQQFGDINAKPSALFINLSKCLHDDVLASGNYYLVGGYAACNKNWILDVSFGSVVKHVPEIDLFSPKLKKGSGVYGAVEWGLNGERFYVTNLLSYRYNVSYDFDDDVVYRNAFAICIKSGIIMTLSRQFKLDMGFGGGPKYIQSFTSNPAKNHLIKEFPSTKYYYSGSGVYPYFFLEFKLLKSLE